MDAEAAVPLDQKSDLRADRLAHGGDALDRLREVGLGDRQARGAERVELQRAVAVGDGLRRAVGEVLGGLRAEVPRVRVRDGAVAEPAAEQRVHRRVKALAEDVPERHLDPAGRGAHDRARVPVAAAREQVGELADPARVPADEAA